MLERMRTVSVPARTACGVFGVLLAPSFVTVLGMGKWQWWFLPPLAAAFLFTFVTGRSPVDWRGDPDRGAARPPLRLVPADPPAPDPAATAWDPIPGEDRHG